MKYSLKQSAKPSPEEARRLYDMFRHADLLKAFTDRYAYLLRQKHDIEKALGKAPEGTLRINRCHNSLQYYNRTSSKDINGTYIPAKRIDLARQLAQKAYHKKALTLISEEIAAIERFLKAYPDTDIEELYDTVNPARKSLITPLTETDDMFVCKWEDVPDLSGPGIPIMSNLFTEKGEKVRSKSEVLIANHLYKNGIPYRYEYPMYLTGGDIIYPDFTILNVRLRKEYVYEHFGMMDDPDYAARAVAKIAGYELNGFYPGENLIMTFETGDCPLNLKLLSQITEKYFL